MGGGTPGADHGGGAIDGDRRRGRTVADRDGDDGDDLMNKDSGKMGTTMSR